MSWRPDCKRTRCSDDVKNSRTPDLQKTKSEGVNETGKVEVQLLAISPGTAAVEWLVIMNLLSVQL